MSRILLSTIGAALGLVLCEVLLRVAGYEGDRERLESIFDAKYGTVRKDSWIWQFKIDPETQGAVKIRQQEFRIRKDPNTTRILFVGDSGTEGAFLPQAASYPAQFKELLNLESPEDTTEVINAGVWGMTTIDEYHFLKEKLLALDADVVVLGLFMANDINFNLNHQEWEFRVGKVGEVLKLLRQRSSLFHFLYLKAMLLSDRFKLIRWERSTEGSWIPMEMRLIDSNGFNMVSYPVGEAATYLKKPSDLIDHAFDVLDQVLMDFEKLAHDSGFQFVVLILPSPSTVAGRLLLYDYTSDGYQLLKNEGISVTPSDFDFEQPVRRVVSICKMRQIACINPTKRLQDIGLRAFRDGDEHYSTMGHAALAAELSDNHGFFE